MKARKVSISIEAVSSMPIRYLKEFVKNQISGPQITVQQVQANIIQPVKTK